MFGAEGSYKHPQPSPSTMAEYSPRDSRTPQPMIPSSSTNGTSAKPSSGLIPTNSVTIREGLVVKARIEPTLAVDDVIRQLCISLKMKDPPGIFALRDESDELVTNDNLKKKIKGKVNLK